MPNHLFHITCTDGGWGWGETGQKGYMVGSGDTPDDAKAHVKPYLPGGWRIEYIGETKRTPGFDPSGGHIDAQ